MESPHKVHVFTKTMPVPPSFLSKDCQLCMKISCDEGLTIAIFHVVSEEYPDGFVHTVTCKFIPAGWSFGWASEGVFLEIAGI